MKLLLPMRLLVVLFAITLVGCAGMQFGDVNQEMLAEQAGVNLGIYFAQNHEDTVQAALPFIDSIAAGEGTGESADLVMGMLAGKIDNSNPYLMANAKLLADMLIGPADTGIQLGPEAEAAARGFAWGARLVMQ